MPQFRPCNEVCDDCINKGYLVKLEEIDTAKIQHMVSLSQADLNIARSTLDDLPKDNMLCNTVYKLYYDALHQLVEAFLRFDCIKSNNHQCLFAYLCEKHSKFDLDWGFFEKIRTKRNGIQYYGKPVTLADWKEAEIQFNLYIALCDLLPALKCGASCEGV